MEQGEIILVTGGARSGKSRFAEQLAANHESVAYIATAQSFDEEMDFRIKKHQERRPSHWVTYEAPFHAENAIEMAAVSQKGILFDCITMYLSNILCALPEEELADQEAIYERTQDAIAKLLTAAEKGKAAGVTTIFVKNEVGTGIVPENKLSRIYRDMSGLANQQLAGRADRVYAVIAGIPVDIKRLAQTQEG